MNFNCVLRAYIQAPHTQTAVPFKMYVISVDDVVIGTAVGAYSAMIAFFICVKQFAYKYSTKPLRSAYKCHAF
ncbi:hypothetical protein SDC9_94588 [bioreactor metagenome]|uniref:Uncharacterized protein n=1 Tax=bioreactor metagenome TaxID=1076179 RepID=A0A645A471_9ZZZZ